MLSALIFGLCLNGDKPLKTSDFSSEAYNQTVDDVQPKPKHYTYKPEQIIIVQGTDTIVFEPNNNQLASGSVVAYEYIFSNTMSVDSAVEIQEISAPNYTISYAWADNSLQDEEIVSSSEFEIQRINPNKSKYLYVLVEPTANSTIFDAEVKWWYGRAKDMEIINAVTGEPDTQLVIAGRPVQLDAVPIPTAPDGYYFDNWFLDDKFTKIATFPVSSETTLYARFANFPQKYITFVNGSTSEYATLEGCTEFTEKIVIPSTYKGLPVTQVGYDTFCDDTTVKEVELPEGIKVIAGGAFRRTPNLVKVNIPSTVTTIRAAAFQDTAITEILIPKNVNLMDSSIFMSCDNLITVTFEQGSQLTSISRLTFYRCHALKNVNNIPPTVEVLGEHSFADCQVLETINLPNGLKVMEKAAFADCPKLTHLYGIGNNLTSIGAYAFEDCCELISIGDLSNCVHLSVIDTAAFINCNKLQSLNLTNCISLTTIGEQAFRNCSSLTSCNMANCPNLETIGARAFLSCTSLTDCSLTKSTKLTAIGDYAFEFCNNLVKCDINNCTSLVSIGIYAFNECFKLEDAGDLSKCTKLTSMGQYAFRRCEAFTKIHLPDSLTTLDANGYQYARCSNVITAVLPKNLTAIPDYFLRRCSALTQVSIPSSVTSIGIMAFFQCSSLTTVRNLENCTKLTNIGNSVFESCTSLTSIYFPDSVTTLHASGYQFYSCSSLKTARLSNNITEIPMCMFQHCTSLTELNMPKALVTINNDFCYNTKVTILDLSACANLTTIGDYAFNGCYSLTSVGDLSKCTKLTTIGNYAFSSRTRLQGSLTLPASVTKIGIEAFKDVGYTEIKFANTTGWCVTESTDYSGGTALTSTDLSTNCTTYLKTTYCTYYWYKQ